MYSPSCLCSINNKFCKAKRHQCFCLTSGIINCNAQNHKCTCKILGVCVAKSHKCLCETGHICSAKKHKCICYNETAACMAVKHK